MNTLNLKEYLQYIYKKKWHKKSDFWEIYVHISDVFVGKIVSSCFIVI